MLIRVNLEFLNSSDFAPSHDAEMTMPGTRSQTYRFLNVVIPIAVVPIRTLKSITCWRNRILFLVA